MEMLSIEKLRKDHPELAEVSDEELACWRDALYPIIDKVLDHYFERDDKI